MSTKTIVFLSLVVTLCVINSKQYAFSKSLVQSVFLSKMCLGCDLQGANFTRGQLAEVNLEGADLRGAKFILANLRGANFTFCNLQNVDFSGADVSGVDFREADISGAIFMGAYTKGAIWGKLTVPSYKFREVSPNMPKKIKNADVEKKTAGGDSFDESISQSAVYPQPNYNKTKTSKKIVPPKAVIAK